MARIINVIQLPHLASYKPFNDSKYRCSTVCEYKVMIEDEDGSILVASSLDDFTLGEFDIDEAVRILSKNDENEDWYFAENGRVDSKRFDCFVNGEIEEGQNPITAFYVVLSNLIRSRHPIGDDLRERLRNVGDKIEKLLNTNE
jgi:hypothetical protein